MSMLTEDQISYHIRGAIFDVYNKLGPGLLESVYEKALAIEIKKIGLSVIAQVPVDILYDGVQIDNAFRMDLLIEDKVIIEIKSVDALADVHHKQLITYLKLTGLKLGILVNFNTTDLNKSIIRKVNGLPPQN
ncbi:MAG: GxxExxY protein [Candidatus Cloacimonetes bacterium]|nr:GxxExxY protein [Candidatus Cloacimonadota bacterium]